MTAFKPILASDSTPGSNAMPETNAMIDLDLSAIGLRQINQQLQSISHGDNRRAFRVTNPMGSHSIAVGLHEPLDILVEGHTGFYCGGMNKEAEITVEGHAGPGLART